MIKSTLQYGDTLQIELENVPETRISTFVHVPSRQISIPASPVLVTAANEAHSVFSKFKWILKYASRGTRVVEEIKYSETIVSLRMSSDPGHMNSVIIRKAITAILVPNISSFSFAETNLFSRRSAFVVAAWRINLFEKRKKTFGTRLNYCNNFL